MRNVEFTFQDNVDSRQQKAILDKINSWDSIESAGLVMADSADEEIKRMAFAFVKDEADLQTVLDRLKTFSEIKSPVEPPKRYPLGS